MRIYITDLELYKPFLSSLFNTHPKNRAFPILSKIPEISFGRQARFGFLRLEYWGSPPVVAHLFNFDRNIAKFVVQTESLP